MADVTQTTAATFLPAVWSQLASLIYHNNNVLVELFDRRWQPELPPGRGKSVNIATFTQRNTSNKRSTFGTGASLTYTAATESQIVLTVNQMAYLAYRIPVEDDVQIMPLYTTLLTDDIGGSIALQIDADLAGDNTDGIDGWSTVVGTDNIDITDDNILTCETNLNNNSAPLEWRYLAVSPATRGSMMKIDVLRNQLYSASVGNLDGEKGPGYIGKVYTFDAYMTNNLESGSAGKKNGAWQRESNAVVIQQDVKVLDVVDIDAGFYRIIAGYMVYGFKEVKDNFGNELDGK